MRLNKDEKLQDAMASYILALRTMIVFLFQEGIEKYRIEVSKVWFVDF